jgi:hypothetical protein
MAEEALEAAAEEIGVTATQILTIGRHYHDQEERLESPTLDPTIARPVGVATPQLLELPPPAAPASPMPTTLPSYEDSPPSLRPQRMSAIPSSPLAGNDILAPKPLHRHNRPSHRHISSTGSAVSAVPRATPSPAVMLPAPAQSQPLPLPAWPWSGTHFEIKEDFDGTVPATIDTVKKRRKYFSNEAMRRSYSLNPDTVYTFEWVSKQFTKAHLNKLTFIATFSRMYDQYIDLNKLSINVGFEIGGRSLFGDKQKIRITFGDSTRRNVFFCIYLDPEDF